MRYIKATLIFVLTWLAYATFAPQEPMNPQVVTRMALALQLMDGRVDIDPYEQYTEDKALFEGHYYADKPPGLSMLAVPALTLTRAVLEASGSNASGTERQTFDIYVRVATVATVGLLGALAAAVLYLLLLRLGASEGMALFATAALALGTPFFGWSTVLFGHVASGSVLLMAVALAIWARQRQSLWPGLLLGLVLGLQLVIDVIAAPAAGLVALFYLLDGRSIVWRRVLPVIVGGVIGLVPFLIYNQVAFQSPFRLGYSQVIGFDGMKEGLFGLTYPNPAVLWEILFGARRGLLPLAPVLVLVPFGLVAMWKRKELRALALLVAGVICCFVAINASYYYWDGGFSTGPRHLIPMLPVAAIALAYAWPEGLLGRVVVLGLLGISMFFAAITAGVDVLAHGAIANPLVELLLPGFFTPDGLAKTAPVLLTWAGFGVVAVLGRRSRPQGNELAA